jgi:hypothetical protein
VTHSDQCNEQSSTDRKYQGGENVNAPGSRDNGVYGNQFGFLDIEEPGQLPTTTGQRKVASPVLNVKQVVNDLEIKNPEATSSK